MSKHRSIIRRSRVLFLAIAVAGLALVPAAASVGSPSGTAPPNSTTFKLFVNTPFRACLRRSSTIKPKATVTVVRGSRNDTLTLTLTGFKSGLGFDMFTVQNSPQKANGSADPGFVDFGLAWYQSDVEVGSTGSSTTTIRTILLDQIFGFDPAVGLAPTNTFHVGFWFDSPDEAAACGFTGFTPFNGEHHAGPLAFVSRPDATTKLGPLCTNPDTSTVPATCNP